MAKEETVRIKISTDLMPSIGGRSFSFKKGEWSKPISGDVLRVMRESGYIVAEKSAGKNKEK